MVRYLKGIEMFTSAITLWNFRETSLCPPLDPELTLWLANQQNMWLSYTKGMIKCLPCLVTFTFGALSSCKKRDNEMAMRLRLQRMLLLRHPTRQPHLRVQQWLPSIRPQKRGSEPYESQSQPPASHNLLKASGNTQLIPVDTQNCDCSWYSDGRVFILVSFGVTWRAER